MTKIVNFSTNETVYEEFEKHVNMKNKWKPPLDRKFSESLFLSFLSKKLFKILSIADWLKSHF
jgi:hypothetical protein